MQATILFYKFTPVHNPDATRMWQTLIAYEHGLRGRIIISEHGINGTLGGDVEALESYIEEMNTTVQQQFFEDMQLPDFSNITYKRGEGGWESFPKLSVKQRDEIVAFKAADELTVDEKGIVGGGKHLTPDEVHQLIEERGDEVIFYDGRNAYEAQIGRFKNTIVPNVSTTKDFRADIESGEISQFKDRPIVTYCTGGIRCEILSTLMVNRGYKEVYQIDGGIVKYGEAYKNDGYWDGKLYVFDNRMVTEFDENTEDIGSCAICSSKTSEFANCDNTGCNKLMVMCNHCQDTVKTCPNCNTINMTIRTRRV